MPSKRVGFGALIGAVLCVCTVLSSEHSRSAPGLTEVCDEYLQLAEQLWAGTDPLPCEPMKDRDLFDFLGFD